MTHAAVKPVVAIQFECLGAFAFFAKQISTCKRSAEHDKRTTNNFSNKSLQTKFIATIIHRFTASQIKLYYNNDDDNPSNMLMINDHDLIMLKCMVRTVKANG